MPIKYLWDFQGRLFLTSSEYQYPLYPHPHNTFIDSKHHEKLLDLLINVCAMNMNALFDRKMTVQECVKNKNDLLLFHSITNEHVQLLDRLIEEMFQDRFSFLQNSIEMDEMTDEELQASMVMAFKASLEWHIFEPFMDKSIINLLRTKWLLNPMTKERSALNKASIQKHDVTYTEKE